MVKIIIVEDEPGLREVLAEELGEAGHHILEASDGVEGLAAIKAESPDVIISDIGMPRMNGYQLRRRLQRCPRFSDTPFLFLSALPHSQAIDRGIDVDANEYLTKPVDFDTLLSRIDALTL